MAGEVAEFAGVVDVGLVLTKRHSEVWWVNERWEHGEDRDEQSQEYDTHLLQIITDYGSTW